LTQLLTAELDAVYVTAKKQLKFFVGHIRKSLNMVNKKLVDKDNQPITAPKKNGGGSAKTNSCASNKVWWV